MLMLACDIVALSSSCFYEKWELWGTTKVTRSPKSADDEDLDQMIFIVT